MEINLSKGMNEKLTALQRYRLAAMLDGASHVRMPMPFQANNSFSEVHNRTSTIVNRRAVALQYSVADALTAEYTDRAIGQVTFGCTLLLLLGLVCVAAVMWNQDAMAMMFTLAFGAMWCSVLRYGAHWAEQLRDGGSDSTVS